MIVDAPCANAEPAASARRADRHYQPTQTVASFVSFLRKAASRRIAMQGSPATRLRTFRNIGKLYRNVATGQGRGARLDDDLSNKGDQSTICRTDSVLNDESRIHTGTNDSVAAKSDRRSRPCLDLRRCAGCRTSRPRVTAHLQCRGSKLRSWSVLVALAAIGWLGGASAQSGRRYIEPRPARVHRSAVQRRRARRRNVLYVSGALGLEANRQVPATLEAEASTSSTTSRRPSARSA